MASNIFPDPQTHNFIEWAIIGDFYYPASDIISFGDPLTVGNVREAYAKGIFPWYMDWIPLPWFCPQKRAIMEFKELHIPKSLKKEQKKRKFTFTIDENFKNVIKSCAEAKRSDSDGTWITNDFIRVYTELHKLGEAHSVEVWDKQGALVGGLYGVDAKGVFCGESMFFKKPNASKLALLFLIDHLKNRSADWIDIQVMTSHMKTLGAKEIDRNVFLHKLRLTQAMDLRLF